MMKIEGALNEPLGGQRTRQSIPWRKLAAPQEVLWGSHTDVVVEPEVVPIVFVPGIMGTRLTGATGMVWDPDASAEFLVNFALNHNDLPSRVRALVGEGGYHPHHLWVPLRQARMHPQRSFDNLVQSVYGKVAQGLTQGLSSRAMDLCLHMPLYAFAYNWTQSPDQSGRALADFIHEVIAVHGAARLCRKVILVTHSMGGIVARAAMRLHGAEESVLGAVHTFMPTAGAPIVYMRAKTGFAPPPLGETLQHRGVGAFAQESVFAALMGPTGEGTAQVLNQLPGALSLLPSHRYEDGAHRPGWMTVAEPGKQPAAHLPTCRDPYEEIYRITTGPTRLFSAPPHCPHARRLCTEPACWQDAHAAIDEVEHLQRRLGTWCHPNSHHIVGCGLTTLDRVQFRAAPAQDGTGPDFTAQDMALMALADGDGDGTVPLQSALNGVEDERCIVKVAGAEHSASMGAPNVLQHIRDRIRMLAHEHITQGLIP